jgi:TIR domain
MIVSVKSSRGDCRPRWENGRDAVAARADGEVAEVGGRYYVIAPEPSMRAGPCQIRKRTEGFHLRTGRSISRLCGVRLIQCAAILRDYSVLGEFDSSRLAFDVFVSYRQQEPGKTWVRSVLIPALQGGGLRVCVDYLYFRLGAPLIKEMERAVESSRCTLTVLTPSYLESNFAEIESILAEHLGLELSERRLIVVMREACKPRLGIRARLWLDMTNEENVQAGLQRLISALSSNSH